MLVILLLDSMMRGVSVGAITIWHPPEGESRGRLFPGCQIVRAHPQLVADGQQRLSTLITAANGDLDHWRWNGEAWTTGPGFLTPSMAVRGTSADALDWYGWVREGCEDRAAINRCVHDREAIARTDMHLMIFDGPAEHMVETYRRLATTGSPHSVDDLAVMESWLASQGDVSA